MPAIRAGSASPRPVWSSSRIRTRYAKPIASRSSSAAVSRDGSCAMRRSSATASPVTTDTRPSSRTRTAPRRPSHRCGTGSGWWELRWVCGSGWRVAPVRAGSAAGCSGGCAAPSGGLLRWVCGSAWRGCSGGCAAGAAGCSGASGAPVPPGSSACRRELRRRAYPGECLRLPCRPWTSTRSSRGTRRSGAGWRSWCPAAGSPAPRPTSWSPSTSAPRRTCRSSVPARPTRR